MTIAIIVLASLVVGLRVLKLVAPASWFAANRRTK